MAKNESRERGRTAEEVVRRTQQAGRSYDSYVLNQLPMFRPKEGENIVRILPNTWSDEKTWGNNWEIKVFVHYSVGPDNSTYLCLDKMKGVDCPVCNARTEATDEQERNDLRFSERHLCWVVDRDNEKAGPQVWSMPRTLFKEINKRTVDNKTGALIKIDGDKKYGADGYDIAFTREGAKLRTDYTGVEVMRDSSPLHDNEKIETRWMDFVRENPLPDLLNYYESDYIEKILFGSRRSEDGGDRQRSRRTERTEDETEAHPTRSVRRGKDEEEETRPSRSSRGREPEPEEEEDDKGDKEEQRRSTSRFRGRSSGEDEPEEEAKGESENEEREARASSRGNGGTRRGKEEEETETETEAEDEDARPRRTTRPRERLALRSRRAVDR